MKTYLKKLLVGLSMPCLSLTGLMAHAAPDPNAGLIALKKVCSASEPNCFISPGLMLDWIWATRKPSAANPLIVDIAPGTWVLPADKHFCPYASPSNGNVTFRGSGRTNTILTGGGRLMGANTEVKAVLALNNCSNLAFQDLGIQSDYRRQVVGSFDGINWRGGAGSSWSNVEVQANGYGWYDSDCGVSPSVTHYWFGSKVESHTGGGFRDAWGFYSQCASTNFYGGQIIGLHDTTETSRGVTAVGIADLNQKKNVFSIYGGSVHATTTVNAGKVTSFGVAGLLAYNGGAVHMHGGSITAEAKNDAQNQDVYGVLAYNNGFGHAVDTAFVVTPSGTGRAYRIGTQQPAFGDVRGIVEAPFFWPAGTNPPTPGDSTGNKQLISTNGNDLFVETDCAATGCQSVGSEPHLLVYSDLCATAGPWFDIVTRKCRGQ